MAWMVHTPSDCRLGKECRDGQQSNRATSIRANAATYAAEAAMALNPSFSALLAAAATSAFNDEEKE